MPSKKINITLQVDLLDRADSYADKHGMTRSGLIAMALSQYLNAVEAMPNVQKLLASMAAVAEGAVTGKLDFDEASKKIEGIKEAYSVLYEQN